MVQPHGPEEERQQVEGELELIARFEYAIDEHGRGLDEHVGTGVDLGEKRNDCRPLELGCRRLGAPRVRRCGRAECRAGGREPEVWEAVSSATAVRFCVSDRVGSAKQEAASTSPTAALTVEAAVDTVTVRVKADVHAVMGVLARPGRAHTGVTVVITWLALTHAPILPSDCCRR